MPSRRNSFVSPHWDAGSFLKFDCVVAELEGRIAGFLVSREIFPSHNGIKAEREILNIAVAPVYRRMGVATLLLQHERSNNATHYLEVRESNSGAQALYRKLGFAEIGRRPEYYDFPRGNCYCHAHEIVLKIGVRSAAGDRPE